MNRLHPGKAEIPTGSAHRICLRVLRPRSILSIMPSLPDAGSTRPARGDARRPRDEAHRRDAPAAPGPRSGADLDRLFPLAYAELRRIARRRLRDERAGHTLDTTALVHEAYLKLTKLERIHWRGRTHVLAIAAQAMRRILVDHAERRSATKRGGDHARVPLAGLTIVVDDRAEDLLLLNDALERLEAVDARQCRVVECRFFAGMGIEETAEALGVSPATVKRDWTHARAWLNRALGE